MKKNILLIGLTMALLVAGSVFAASAKTSAKAAGSVQLSGTIVSADSSQLVLSCHVKGKAEQETFIMNPATKTTGSLKAGNKAVVRYKDENGQKVATMVRASSVNKTASTKTTK